MHKRSKLPLQALLLLIIVAGVPLNATAQQDDIDALLKRLAKVEAEQAKSNETIKTLRQEIEALRKETKDDQLAVEQHEPVPVPDTDLPADEVVQKTTPPTKPATPGIFVEMDDESRFEFVTEGGDFSLGIDGTIIGRYEVNRRRDDGTGVSDTDRGFEMTGTRVNFKGTLYGDFGYWARLNADTFGTDPFFDAALITYRVNDNTNLVVGQFPSLLTREQGTPVDKTQTTEASATNYVFDPFAYKGVMLGYHTPRMVFRGIINDGYQSASNYAFDEPSAKWAFAGQVSGLAVGDKDDWGRFSNFTSRPGSDFAWLLNAGFHVQEGDTHSPGGDGSDDVVLGVIESSMEGDGWNFYSAGYYRYTDPNTDEMSVSDFGFVLQGGVWVAKHFEFYSRFDMTIPDNDRPVENENFRTLTAGLTYYPIPHTDNIKVMAETQYFFDPEAYSIVEPNIFTGVRASSAGDQVVFRIQTSLRW